MTPERGTPEAAALEAGLSASECQVFFRYVEGQGYAEIAAALGISYHAVECHISNIGKRIRAEITRRQELDDRQETLAELVAELRQADLQEAERLNNFQGDG